MAILNFSDMNWNEKGKIMLEEPLTWNEKMNKQTTLSRNSLNKTSKHITFEN